MKTQLFSIVFLFMIYPAFAQDPLVKKIEVVGSAEKEIIPDEIYLSISLREYKNKNNNIIPIQTLENQLAKAVKDIGISEENFQIENIYGSHNWWRRKKEDPEFLASKRYRLKLNELNKVNLLLSKLDPLGIEHMNISEYSHSRIQEYRTALKIQALVAAKEKAQNLVQSIGQNLGEAIEIYEIEAGGPVYPMMEFRMANAKMDAADTGAQDIGFRTIKIKADIRAVFRID
jgi:uncharacterized protein